MEYRGHEISEEIVWFDKKIAYTEFESNPCYLEVKDLQNIINEYEKLCTKLDSSSVKYRNLKIELDAAEDYCSDDYHQYNSKGFVDINFTWQEPESDEKREKRIASEKAKIDKEIEATERRAQKVQEEKKQKENEAIDLLKELGYKIEKK
jgi:hypothetical protein